MEALRATFATFTRQSRLNTGRQLAELAKYQQQLSTGLKVNLPSDDPLAIAPILSTKSALLSLQNENSTLENAKVRLDVSVSNLIEAKNLLVRAKQIAIDGASSLGETERGTLALELKGVLDSLVRVSNTQFEGRPIFAGNDSDGDPFNFQYAADGKTITDVAYAGAQTETPWQVDAFHAITVYHDGSVIFGGKSRQTTSYTGPTGAAAGQGTDSGSRRGQLVVTHTSTTYAAGSGVQVGTNSPNGDTILGPTGVHTLEIRDTSGTGASGVVRLNGGPEIPFTSADANLEVTSANGSKVFINTTAITAGFNGTVNITANGTLSTDGGATSVPIDFSNNQQVINSQTGAVTWVNSTNIRASGTDLIQYRGTSTAFQTLIDAISDLKGTNGLNNVQTREVLKRGADDLDRAIESITSTFGVQSAALEGIELALKGKQTLEESWTARLANLESADPTEAVIKVKEQETLLQYTLAITARVSQLSLLNYL